MITTGKMRIRRNRVIGCGGLAFVIVLGASGCAAPGPAEAIITEEWQTEEGFTGRRLVTDHFEIFSTVHDAEFEAALPVFLEAAYRRFADTLPPRQPAERLVVYLFGTRREWERFMRIHYPDRYELYTRIRAGGFTEGDTALSFYSDRPATWATLAHEGWHQYVNSRLAKPMPAWLNEGLACVHEAVEFVGPQPRFTPDRNLLRAGTLRDAVLSDGLLSLEELVKMHAGEALGQSPPDFALRYYAQSWALVHFLRYGENGRWSRALDRMLRDIADDTFHARVSAARLVGDADPAEAGAFRLYFGQAPGDLDDAYRRHLLQITQLPSLLNRARKQHFNATSTREIAADQRR